MTEEIPEKAKELLDTLAEDIKKNCQECKVRECPETLEEIIVCEKYKKKLEG